MGLFARGNIVIADLPYSDLSGVKRRPVFVLAAPDGFDLIECLITSRAKRDGYDVRISQADFESGGLAIDSNVRPIHLFSLDPRIVARKVGHLNGIKADEILNLAIQILRSG